MNGLLFIDDEEGVRRSVARAFRKGPYPIFTAENGDQGIAFVRENISQVSTVVSDYRMPGLDGLETLAVIGTISPEITRIILTGYATMEAAIEATNEGVDGFLTKPFENVELKAKIHEINVRKRLKQFIPARLFPEIDSSVRALEPRYHEATILFSDIRGFTRMSQECSPETVAAFLNDEYFSPMGEIAHQHRGMVDKHIGDSIMIVFGAPVSHAEDPFMAVSAAIEMQKKARKISVRSRKKNGLRHRIGIGISTGEVFSGILGSRCKKEFTSIGMAVNIAARLQSIAIEGEILINESTYRRVVDLEYHDRIETEELPPVSVKGLDNPIKVYRVIW
jgi:adenylate cyclase